MKNNPKYIMSFTSIGDYRLEVMQKVTDNLKGNLSIYAGEEAFDPSVKLINKEEMFYIRITNLFLMNRKVLLQILPYWKYLVCDTLLLDLNPRIINVWFLIIVRYIIRKPVVVWGHAWPRKGKDNKSDVFRGILRKLSKNIVVYTETQANELILKDPKLKVLAAPNALYKSIQMEFVKGLTRNDILYVGRLVKEKKPELLLHAFINACENPDFSARLIFVGDGNDRSLLESVALQLPYDIRSRVLFLGHITGYKKISKLYESAFVSISPGYVGLSITQSFSFGVPMIISKDEPHAPEIEAAIEGENSSFFQTDNIFDLSKMLQKFHMEKEAWSTKGDLIVNECKQKYSIEVMAERLCQAIENAQ